MACRVLSWPATDARETRVGPPRLLMLPLREQTDESVGALASSRWRGIISAAPWRLNLASHRRHREQRKGGDYALQLSYGSDIFPKSNREVGLLAGPGCFAHDLHRSHRLSCMFGVVEKGRGDHWL